MADMNHESQPSGDGRRKQTTQIVLLVILLAAFGYLYFFTPLIRPQGEKNEASPAPPAQMVKKPIPKEKETASTEKPKVSESPSPTKQADASKKEAKATGPQGGEGAKALKQPLPPTPAQQAQAKPAQQPQAKPAQQPQAKPAQQAQAKPAQQAQAKPAQQAQAKPAQQAQAKPAQQRTVEKPAIVPPSPKEPKQGEERKGKGVGSTDSPRGAAKSGKGFAIAFGDVPEGAVFNDLRKRLASAGIVPVTTKPVTKTVTVQRLLVDEVMDHDAALREVSSLRKKKIDAFMGESGDRYRVFAGSYLYRDRAETEQRRLESMGVRTSIVPGEVQLRLIAVTAGSFPDRFSAERKLSQLSLPELNPAVVERK